MTTTTTEDEGDTFIGYCDTCGSWLERDEQGTYCGECWRRTEIEPVIRDRGE